MIRLCEGTLPSLPLSEASVRIGCLARAYVGTGVVRCFADNAGNLLCLMDGHAVWQTAEVTPEWVLFIAMQPEILSVYTDAASAMALADALDGETTVGEVLELSAPLGIAAPLPVSPREYYPVLSAVFGEESPRFDAWYADVMLRQRRGLCRTFGVIADEKVVSVAMTVAETADGAVIGGVATLPEHRLRGYAARAVIALAVALQAEGKRVFICPKNETAARLYRTLGFVSAARFGEFVKKT